MEKIRSFEEIQVLFNEIRSLKKGFITNFYPDPGSILLWCSYNSLFCIRYTNIILFLRIRERFVNLFYCSVSEEALKDILPVFLKEHSGSTIVTDLVGNESVTACKQLFLSEGFKDHTLLVRMSRIGLPVVAEEKMSEMEIEEATLEDIPFLQRLYTFYFDPYSEQIPLKEELEQWINAGHILIKRINEEIAGFLIYDLIGVTLYLRYWFVHPCYRDQKIGSILLQEFFFRGKNSKRQLFWVLTSNENAIKRYIHYGFSKEKMFDYVLIKK
jgi:ribosomal protein S18 acetylase RimI-like enzyme